MKDHETRTIGRDAACHVVLPHSSVSRLHATAWLTAEGYLAVQDADSSNGLFLRRNGRWIRVRKVILGTQDRIRFGEQELELDRLLAAFGHARVRLREGYSVRGKPLVFDDLASEPRKPRSVLENPRRNPLTGNVEENPGDKGYRR